MNHRAPTWARLFITLGVMPFVTRSVTTTMAARGARRGFTFIEVVLAIMLSVGLAATALWFYRHTGEVRNEISEELTTIAARRQVMSRITADLRHAVAVPLLGVGVDGQTDRITFITAALPARSTWAAQNVTDEPLPPEQDLRLVTYGLRIVEDDDGLQTIEGLEAQAEKLLTMRIVEDEAGATVQAEAAPVTSVVLAPFVLFVRFRYWNGIEWLDQWQESGMPQAVEVALGEKPLPEGVAPADYEDTLSRRVIYLPGAGGAAPQGNVIRGLGGGR